jgi:hypothetical protein
MLFSFCMHYHFPITLAAMAQVIRFTIKISKIV